MKKIFFMSMFLSIFVICGCQKSISKDPKTFACTNEKQCIDEGFCSNGVECTCVNQTCFSGFVALPATEQILIDYNLHTTQSQETNSSTQVGATEQPAPKLPPKPSADSGVRGVAMIGPTCPVMRNPPDPQCADKPYAALLIFSNQAGVLVKQVQAKSDGTFEVFLPAGEYTVSQTEGKIYPILRPQTVTVIKGQFTSLLLQFDSGIR